MKYSNWLGVLAAVVLVISCTLNWTWYPDLQQYFNGFYTHDNNYGRPGRVFAFFAVIAIIFYLLPQVWAKRWNFLVCGLTVAYAIKTFILFTSCYRGICPEKQFGIWLMLVSTLLMLAASLMPRGRET